MNEKELKEILEFHLAWIKGEDGGKRANLQGANLWGADLQGAFIGWKKAMTDEDEHVIVKLLIPDDAKRSSSTTRKCRCDKAKVEEIYDYEFQGDKLALKSTMDIIAHSNYDKDFVYKKGEAVSVTDFCKDRWRERAPGIHFFITPEEATRY